MSDELYYLSESYESNSALRLLMRMLPFGGEVDTQLTKLYDKLRAKKVKAFFKELEKGSLKLTPDYIQTDDFLEKYFITIRAALDGNREEKVKYFARLLNNSQSELFTNKQFYYDDILKTLDELTIFEIEVLVSIREYEIELGKGLNRFSSGGGGVFSQLENEMRDKLYLNKDDMYAVFTRLERTGCLLFGKGLNPEGRMNLLATTDFFLKIYALALEEPVTESDS